jgi:succinate-semialdehyde dehydrogenase/glutarate-semialdehyde dehydrogenase
MMKTHSTQCKRLSLTATFLAATLTRPNTAFSTTCTTTNIHSVLRNPSLLPNLSSGDDDSSFQVYNPAQPDEIVAHVPRHSRKDTKEAIDRAAAALPEWRDKTTAKYRASLLTEWSRLIQENIDDIATIMTLESGKPIAESKGEVNYGTSFLDFYAAEAIRPTGAGGGMIVPTPFDHADGSPRGKIMAIQQAIGVCGLITPWNFPIAMITRKAGPALAAGCTAVVKPATLTPLTAIALEALAIQAGIPRNVFQLVTSDKASDVGDEMCENPLVRKISFTGSTGVGKHLMNLSSGTMKKLSLELGGNAPFVVFEDADIDQAVSAAMASKFRNAGQTCVCSDRFLIQQSVHDEFVEKMAERVKELKIGPGMDESTKIGPLITSKAADTTQEKIEEAIAEGATCVVGGSRLKSLGPNFLEPTILTNVSTESRIWKEETFGPCAAIRSFETEEEALAIANDSEVGLAGYFCSNDLSRVFRFASKLETGIIGVNDGIISTCSAPFGGIKESGLGREGSTLGLAEYMETKYIFVNC